LEITQKKGTAMPKGSEHKSSSITKMLLIGESGSGKTGALASLAAAGYKLRIWDMDEGLDYLMFNMRKYHKDKLDNIEYESLRDKLKSAGGAGIISSGVPTAYTRAVGLMDKWTDGTRPSEWGPEYIAVIDSLTFLGNAAFRWKEALNPSAKDPRQIFYSAQEAVEDVLALLTSSDFNTNLIVTSHVRWLERQDGSVKAFPSAIGGALGPKIPAYFNSLCLTETTGTGTALKRQIRTAPTAFMDLKNPAEISTPMPIETGLAEFFKAAQS
jgi:hypothetical protein